MDTLVSCKGCGKGFAPKRRKGSRWVGKSRAAEFCLRSCEYTYRHTPEAVAERFWRSVDKSAGPDGCWLWTGGKNELGYGQFSMGKHGAKYIRSAHRMAYEMVNAPLGDLFACHRCDVPACVNPAHIFAGTAADNTRDMDFKGRRASGKQAARAYRFTEDQIRGIRQARAKGESNAAISAQFGISPKQIAGVANGKIYAWVTSAGAADR